MKSLETPATEMEVLLAKLRRYAAEYERILKEGWSNGPSKVYSRFIRPHQSEGRHFIRHRHLIAGGRKKWLLRRWRR